MKSLSAAAIAEMVNGKILGDENKVCTGVASVRDANSDTISFVGSKKYQHVTISVAGTKLVYFSFRANKSSSTALVF